MRGPGPRGRHGDGRKVKDAKGTIKRLLGYVAQYKVRLVLVLLCMLFSGSLHLVTSTWGFKTSALKLPKGGVYMCAPICFGYMALQTLGQLITAFKTNFDKKEAK